jgi:hypothetical protein
MARIACRLLPTAVSPRPSGSLGLLPEPDHIDLNPRLAPENDGKNTKKVSRFVSFCDSVWNCILC